MVKRDSDVFWDGVEQGELRAQQCSRCNTLRHPPSAGCPYCGSLDAEVRRLSGRGTIHGWLVSKHPSNPDPEPRVVIVVEMEEGVRVVSNLIDRQNAAIGAPVDVEFGEVDGLKLALFRTRASGQPGAAA